MTPILRTLALASLLGATACASLPQMDALHLPSSLPGGEETTPSRGSAREHVRAAVELLDAGNERQARGELRAALEMQPNNRSARRLMEQIETDPRELLGARARSYTVQPGETMSEIANRFLGDPLLFYALARYNGLNAPNQISAGQTLQVPQRVVTTASTNPATPPSPATSGTVTAVAAPAPARPGIDPSRAGQLRLQGLQRLNTGDVNGAVVLLQQAQTLDAENQAIQRDLDRALRMQASLRTN